MRIGPYSTERIIERLGSATVYAARHVATGQAVLVTVIEPESEEMAADWMERLEAANRLQHPNILPFLDVRQSAHFLYAISSRLPTAIPPDGALTPDATADLLAQVAAGVDYAYEQGLDHSLLQRRHVVRKPDGNYAVRGFELAGDLPVGSAAGNVVALGELAYRALTGQDFSADETFAPGIPFPIARV